MASRSPLPSKRGRREDGDDESRHRKKLEKGKEPAAKDVEEEPLFDDTKFAVELLRSAFRKLQGVGEAFDIKAHHDVYKDPTVKGLGFRIHELAEKLENLPVVKRAAHRHFFFDDDGSDSDNGSHSDDGSHGGDDGSHGGDDGDDGSHGGGTPAN
jgi:ribosomal protein S8E